MKVFYESLDDIAEDERDQFVEVEWDGKKGYQHESVAKLANAYNQTKEKLTSIRTESEEIKSRLDKIDEERRKEVEEAERRAYEKAKKDGNVEEIEKRHQEQLEHSKKGAFEEGYNAAKKEFAELRAKEKAKSRASRIASKLAVDEFAAEILEEQILKSISVDVESEQETFLDAEGKATTWTPEAFEEQVLKNKRFERLIKGELTTKGGGNANGSGGGKALTKPLKDMTDKERLEFKERDPVGFQQALKGK